MTEHIADSDLVMIVLEPCALGKVNSYRRKFVYLGYVVDDIVSQKLVSFVGVDSRFLEEIGDEGQDKSRDRTQYCEADLQAY